MDDILSKVRDASGVIAAGLMIAAIVFGGAALWSLESRVPSEIPPHWFETKVDEIREEVEKMRFNEVEKLKETVATLEREVEALKASD